MLEYPAFNPIALALGPLEIRWYGIAYVVGIMGAWVLLHARRAFAPEPLSDLIFYAVIGIILGGRLGYFVFYDPLQIFSNPIEVLKIWHPGMSFHGGMLGVLIATALFARKQGQAWLAVTDAIAPVVPIGLAAGRIGNFINAELWGRISDVPWAMVVPHAGPWPRHPSPLYACILEGGLLFIVLWAYTRYPRKIGQVSALFLIGYAVVRCFGELFRAPDPHYGFIAWGWLTMGQVLCVPMFLAGLGLWFYAARGKNERRAS